MSDSHQRAKEAQSIKTYLAVNCAKFDVKSFRWISHDLTMKSLLRGYACLGEADVSTTDFIELSKRRRDEVVICAKPCKLNLPANMGNAIWIAKLTAEDRRGGMWEFTAYAVLDKAMELTDGTGRVIRWVNSINVARKSLDGDKNDKGRSDIWVSVLGNSGALSAVMEAFAKAMAGPLPFEPATAVFDDMSDDISR